MESEWLLAFILPSLALEESYIFGDIIFVPNADARLAEIGEKNQAAKYMLKGFRGYLGDELEPVGLIHSRNTPISSLLEAIVDARNVLAMSCVLNGARLTVGHPNVFLIRNSDYFDFYPLWPSRDGQNFAYFGPAQETIQEASSSFSGQGHAFLPRCNQLLTEPKPDLALLEDLRAVWNRAHLEGNTDSQDRRLFRSLSLAYEASRVPQAMDNLINDHGKHCSLWVSALETLAHPGDGRVNLNVVLELLGQRDMTIPDIAEKRFSEQVGKRNQSLNFLQYLYCCLYKARNAFLHGNEVSEQTFLSKHLVKGVSLLSAAPLIYQGALESYLKVFQLSENHSSAEVLTKACRCLDLDHSLHRIMINARPNFPPELL